MCVSLPMISAFLFTRTYRDIHTQHTHKSHAKHQGNESQRQPQKKKKKKRFQNPYAEKIDNKTKGQKKPPDQKKKKKRKKPKKFFFGLFFFCFGLVFSVTFWVQSRHTYTWLGKRAKNCFCSFFSFIFLRGGGGGSLVLGCILLPHSLPPPLVLLVHALCLSPIY